MSFSIKMTISSDTKYLSVLRDLIKAVANITGTKIFSHEIERACTLSLIEAVNNAIFHAHKENLEDTIDVSLTVDTDNIIISVTDMGKGFDASKIEDPEILSISGRGFYLISHLMTDVKTVCYDNKHSVIMKYVL